MLPPKVPKKAKRSSRWRSQAHLTFVRKHQCSVAGCLAMAFVSFTNPRSGCQFSPSRAYPKHPLMVALALCVSGGRLGVSNQREGHIQWAA